MLIQDLRGLFKVFSIVASTESLILLAFLGISIVCKLYVFHT